MIFFVWVASCVITPARPTSEPVPAVVGTATTGAMPVRIGARPPVADILEIPHRPGLAGHEGDDLADIERGAAAEGDDAVMPAGAQGLEAGVDVGLDRVRLDVGEHRGFEPRVVEDRERLRGHRLRREERIGDEERPADAGDPAGLGELGDAAGAEAHGGGVVPVGAGAGHRVSGAQSAWRRWKDFGPGDGVVAEGRQARAAAGVLDARPGEAGIEIVAAVHEHRAGLEPRRRCARRRRRPRSRSRR